MFVPVFSLLVSAPAAAQSEGLPAATAVGLAQTWVTLFDQDEDDVNTLDDIFTFLDEGLEEPDTFTPEMHVEFHDGDFNIEYVVIYDQDGKVLFKDPDYNE